MASDDTYPRERLPVWVTTTSPAQSFLSCSDLGSARMRNVIEEFAAQERCFTLRRQLRIIYMLSEQASAERHEVRRPRYGVPK